MDLQTSFNQEVDLDDDPEEYAELLPPDYDSINLLEAKVPSKRWLYMFPKKWEDTLKRFDDPIVKKIQRIGINKFFYYFDLAITSLVSIEGGFVSPFILMILGFDDLAFEVFLIVLLVAFLSQIPKRFIFRYRPYMVGRAVQCKKDTTSSFPSRAVTCATTWSFAICYSYLVESNDNMADWHAEWWMFVLPPILIFLSVFARVNLGVHYPSDCAAGFLLGSLISLLAYGVLDLNMNSCQCRMTTCYAHQDTINISNLFDRINLITLFITLGGMIIVSTISIMKPVDFWIKADRVYGLLFPVLLFKLLFLCPSLSSTPLAPPPTPSIWGVLYGVGFAALLTGFGFKFNGKYPFVILSVIFITNFSLLVLWRVVLN